jgi:hypothetical protein
VDFNLLSDERLLQDFYEGEFRENPQPDNAFALTKLGDDYSLTTTIPGGSIRSTNSCCRRRSVAG